MAEGQPLLEIRGLTVTLGSGHDAVRGEIVHQLGGVMGRDGATAVQGLLKSASEPKQGFAGRWVGRMGSRPLTRRKSRRCTAASVFAGAP